MGGGGRRRGRRRPRAEVEAATFRVWVSGGRGRLQWPADLEEVGGGGRTGGGGGSAGGGERGGTGASPAGRGRISSGRWRGRRRAGSMTTTVGGGGVGRQLLARRGRAGARGAAANEGLRGDGWRRRKIMPHGSWGVKMTVVRWIFIQR